MEWESMFLFNSDLSSETTDVRPLTLVVRTSKAECSWTQDSSKLVTAMSLVRKAISTTYNW